MKSFGLESNDIFTEAYLKQKLKEYYGDNLIIVEHGNKSPIICLKSAGSKILSEKWFESNVLLTPSEKKMD